MPVEGLLNVVTYVPLPGKKQKTFIRIINNTSQLKSNEWLKNFMGGRETTSGVAKELSVSLSKK